MKAAAATSSLGSITSQSFPGTVQSNVLLSMSRMSSPPSTNYNPNDVQNNGKAVLPSPPLFSPYKSLDLRLNQSDVSGFLHLLNPQHPACRPRADLLILCSSPVPTSDLPPLHLHLHLPHYYPCAEYTLNVHSKAKNMGCTEKFPIVRKRQKFPSGMFLAKGTRDKYRPTAFALIQVIAVTMSGLGESHAAHDTTIFVVCEENRPTKSKRERTFLQRGKEQRTFLL